MKLPWSKTLALPPQLEWKYAGEPALMSWTIKARNYNTFVANIMFSICFIVVVISTSLAGFWFDRDLKLDIPGSIGFFLVMISVVLSVTHQRMNFAYRLSKSGIEYCEWKFLPKWPIIIVNCFAAVVMLFLMFMLRDDPAGMLIGLAGAGGIGLTAVATLNSESFRKLHTTFHHVTYTWDRFEKISIYKSRHIIGLNFEWENFGKKLNAIVNIFCHRKDVDKRLAMIESLLPKPIPVVV
ncbi:hypothetical protein, partial [Pseudomonas aeruginosa]